MLHPRMRNPPLSEEELGKARLYRLKDGVVEGGLEPEDSAGIPVEMLPRLKEVAKKGELESGARFPGKVREGFVVETGDRRFVVDSGVTHASRGRRILWPALAVVVAGSVGVGLKLARTPPSHEKIVEVASLAENASGDEKTRLASERNHLLRRVFPGRTISVEEAGESYESFRERGFSDKDIVLLMSRGWTRQKLDSTLAGAERYGKESGIRFTPVPVAIDSGGNIAVFIPSYPATLMCFYLGDKESVDILPEHSASVAEHEINHFADAVYHKALTKDGMDRSVLFRNAKRKLLAGSPSVRGDFESVERVLGVEDLNDLLEEVRVEACGRHSDGRILLCRAVIGDLEKKAPAKLSASPKDVGMIAVYGTLAGKASDEQTAERYGELAEKVLGANPANRGFYESFLRVCDAQYEESYAHRDESLKAARRWQDEAERKSRQREDLKAKREDARHDTGVKPQSQFTPKPEHHRRM